MAAMAYLLDTNVVCEATAKHSAARVLAWIEAHAHECFLSRSVDSMNLC